MPNIYLTENLFNKAFGILPWRYIGSEKNNNALVWTLTTPNGDIITVSGLRHWAKSNGHKYQDIYNSKNGWNAVKHGSGRGGGRKKKEHNSGI
jgi:hypothetical protein